jgi:CheY-like chemotaxis protein
MSTILIADDEANIVMLLEIVLKDLDTEIITAENGEIAIEKARKYKPD